MVVHGLLRGIALQFYMYKMLIPNRKHLWTATACYGDSFTFLYADDVRTSKEIHLWAYTACYGDCFIFLYVYDVRTSQETHL
jgi:hypothetical protein